MKNPDKDEFYHLSATFWDDCKTRLEAHGYSVVDPRSVIEDMAVKEKNFPYTVDGHLNGEGYRRVARMIMAEIDKINKL